MVCVNNVGIYVIANSKGKHCTIYPFWNNVYQSLSFLYKLDRRVAHGCFAIESRVENSQSNEEKKVEHRIYSSLMTSFFFHLFSLYCGEIIYYDVLAALIPNMIECQVSK